MAYVKLARPKEEVNADIAVYSYSGAESERSRRCPRCNSHADQLSANSSVQSSKELPVNEDPLYYGEGFLSFPLPFHSTS